MPHVIPLTFQSLIVKVQRATTMQPSSTTCQPHLLSFLFFMCAKRAKSGNELSGVCLIAQSMHLEGESRAESLSNRMPVDELQSFLP